MKYEFPKDFLWGAATASHQIEGGLTNNWTQWELKTALRNSKRGIRPRVESLKKMANEKENYFSNSKYSPESFKNWKRDVEVIKKLGLKAYRLSIEWSRIEPEKGKFSKEGIQYYKNLLRELKENDVKVVLTCWHWSLPIWLSEEKGLLSKNIYKYFKRYVSYLYDNLSEYVDYWLTINEPQSFILSYLVGIWPPGKRNIFNYLKVLFKVFPKMHIGAYEVIKEKDESTKVSFAKNVVSVVGYNNFFLNRAIQRVSNWYINLIFMDKVRNHLDFIGLNFYFHNRVGILGLRNSNDRISDLGWWLKPQKLYDVIKMMYEKYKLPIIVTENGLADSRDEDREWWIEESVKAMHRAIEEGCEVFGYLHWSLLDNFEWDKGYWPKFGLVSVDSNTKERKIKKSGKFYKEIIQRNGL